MKLTTDVSDNDSPSGLRDDGLLTMLIPPQKSAPNPKIAQFCCFLTEIAWGIYESLIHLV